MAPPLNDGVHPLHTGLDVLSIDEFSSRGEPSEAGLPVGLSWKELEKIVTTALKVGVCYGCSLVIYNPDRDIEGKDATCYIFLELNNPKPGNRELKNAFRKFLKEKA